MSMPRLRNLVSRRKKRDRKLQTERLEARQLLFGTPLGQFVDAAYQDVLERRAESGGLEFWSGLLGTNAISRADVARSILNSAEYTRGEVSDLYTELLGRPADAGGLNFWAAAVQGGTSLLDVQAGFLGSNEYFASHGGANASFVAAAYQDILGRPAATSESAFWLAQLGAISRQQVARQIIYSPENLQQEVDGWYQLYLHRSADAGGLAYWTNLLSHGTNPTAIQTGFLASPEYYERETAPAIRVPSAQGQTVPTTIHWGGNTDLHSEVGLFVVENDAGIVGGLAPGHQDYAQTALSSASRQVIFTKDQAPTNTSVTPGSLPGSTTLNLPAGALLGIYLVQNGAAADALPPVPRASRPNVFFSFPTGNGDAFDHYRYGNYVVVGIEDLTSGGDKDFNDIILQFEFPDEDTSPPVNQPPVIAAIADQTIPEEAPWQFQVSATDPDGPASAIRYSLDAASTALGIAIDPVTGLITWTPNESQGPGTYSLVVRASDGANPAGVGERTFLVNVTELNRPPVLADIPSRIVDAGQSVSITAAATDPDVPANTLLYSLDTVTATAGATIDPATGVFSWTPTPDQAGQSFTVTVRVSDQVTPALTDETQFTLTVDSCSFDSDPEAWTSFEDGGSETGAGTSSIEVMAATLVEGDSFVVGIQREIVIPAAASQLRFSIFDEVFDTSSSGEIRDAFEAALVDDQGRSVVLPFADGRDAFFNLTEGLPAAMGPGVAFDGNTVVVDLSGVTVSNARLIFRLVNNDADTESTVSLTCVRVEALAAPLLAPSPLERPNSTATNQSPSAASNSTPMGPALPAGVMPRSAPTGASTVTTQDLPLPPGPPPIDAFAIDNRGTDFWLGFADNLLEGGNQATKTLFITGDIATTGNVSVPGLGFSQDFVVNPGEVTAVVLPTQVEVETIAAIQDLGIHVVADDEVTVYGLNRAQNTTDAFLALPTDSLGTEYMNLTYQNDGYFLAYIAGTQLLIVGAQDDTQVTIDPGRYSLPTPNSNVTLTGPSNNNVVNIGNGVDSGLITTDRAGNYTLNVTPPTIGYAGTYRFRLLDLASNSTPIAIGQTVAGSLPNGQDTLVYRFAGATGQTVFIDGLSPTSTPNSFYRVISPSGVVLSQNNSENNSEYLTLAETGDFYVLVSTMAATTPVNFSFRVLDIADATSIALNTVIEDTIPVGARRTDVYKFQGVAGQQLAFDGQSIGRGTDVIVYTPAGAQLTTFVSADDRFPITLPVSGSYSITVDGRVPGEDYAFRVLDLADATPVVIETTTPAATTHAKELAVFEFAGIAGQELQFDALSAVGYDLQVLGPTGAVQFLGRTNNDSDVWALPATGTYQIFMLNQATAPTAFPFRLLDLANADVYALDSTVTGNLDALQSKAYRFDLSVGLPLFYDGLDGDFDNVRARVIGPNGALIGPFFNADSDSAIARSTSGGTGYLFVSNDQVTPADFGLRLHDLSHAPALALDTNVTANLPTGREAGVYRVDANVGDRLIYDGRTGSGSVPVRLIGPSGSAIFQANSNSDSPATTIVEDGEHYLFVFGGVSGATNVEFRMHDVANAPVLPLGVDTQATLNPGTALTAYRLNATAGQRITLDSLAVSANGAGSWILVAPNNAAVIQRNLEVDFAADLTQTGEYLLVFQGNGAQATAQATFRATVTTPAPVAPAGFGTTQTLTIAAGQTATYQFSGSAGTVIYLDSLNPTNQGLRVDLRDPSGVNLINASDFTDQGPFTLPSAGTYSVVLSGILSSQSGNFTFRVLDLSAAPPLTFGALNEGTLPPLAAAVYQFPAALGDSYYYNGVDTDFDNMLASVVLPSGVHATQLNADSDTRVTPINETGTAYVLIQNNLNSTPDYRFRLVNLGDAPTMALGDLVTGTFPVGTELLAYQFDAVAGQTLVYDGLDNDFDNVSAQLLGPGGVQPFFINSDQQFGPFVVTQSGTYTLLMQANTTAGANFTFRMLDASASPEIQIGDVVAGNVGASGREVKFFSFDATAGQQLFYDALDGDFDSVFLSIRDPFNNEIRSSNADLDSAVLPLASDGTYTVFIYGNAANADFSFQLQDLDDATPLILGDEVTGQTAVGRDTVSFTFDAVLGQKYYFNGLDNDNDPTQVFIQNEKFQNVLQRNSSSEDGIFTATSTGRYYVFLVGRTNAPEDYRFRFLNVSGAPTIDYSDEVSGTVPLGTDHFAYRFDGTAGQRIYFDGLDSDSDQINARIISPSGVTYLFTNSDNNSGVFSLGETGTHYLIVEGNAAPGADYRFRLLDVDAAQVLTYGVDIAATLDTGREVQLFRVPGVPGNSVLFDSLSTGFPQVGWSLTDPANRNVAQGSQIVDFTSTLLYGGDYVLIVSGLDFAPVNYSFRATQTTLPTAPLTGFGVDQTAELEIGESATFNFSAPIGRLMYLDVLQSTFAVPTHTITLDAGQTYLLRDALGNNDLTGTVITSDKPVAAYGSHLCAFVPDFTGYCDHLVEQLPPTDSWGREFITVPLATRLNGDTFRFLAQDDGTEVRVNGTLVATLLSGQYHEMNLKVASEISANHPILVAQYSNGTTFDNVTSDPFMVYIPPFEQYLSNYTVTTPATGFAINYVNIVASTADVGLIEMDGAPIAANLFAAIGASGFSGAKVPVQLGAHAFAGPSPFGLTVYGYSAFDSYGYTGGQSLARVAAAASLDLTVAQPNVPIGVEAVVRATVLDDDGAPLPGVRVDFAVAGANPQTAFAFTDENGVATLRYIGAIGGLDTIDAAVSNLVDSATINWTAPTGPPRISILTPDDDADIAAGTTVAVTGIADADLPFATVVLVTVNGQPVEAIDAAGNFFVRVAVLPGENFYEFEVTDSLDQTSRTTLVLNGVQRTSGDPDFDLLSNVSASFSPQYARTSLQDDEDTLFADIAIRNDGQYPADAPLFVAIRNLSDPTVRVLDADGFTPDGAPYYDFTGLVTGGTLAPRGETGFLSAQFFTPERSQFTYDLEFFGKLNTAPAFSTTPVVDALAERSYRYESRATDDDGDTVTFLLPVAPDGMLIDTATGAIDWLPGNDDLGLHEVTVLADDGRGGTTEQRFLINVITPPPNRPPVFATLPIVSATAEAAYTYDADATDADGDALLFALLSAPSGMAIDDALGVITWTPTAAQVGDHEIVVEVVDGAGGRAEQRFVVCVELTSTTPGPTNYAPVITTQPGAQAVVGAPFAYVIAAQDADGDAVTFTLDDAPAGATLTPVASLPNRALLTWTPAAAGSASFTILAPDGQGGQATQQFDVNAVAGATNHNPVIDSTPRASIPLGRTWFYFPAASDEDHDLLTFSLDASPTGMTVDPVTGLLTWTPSDDQVGAASVTLRVTDGRGGSVTQGFSIEVTANEANGAPTIISVPTTAAIVAETEFRYRARATDPDFDPIAWRLVDAPEGVSIDAVTGEVRWTPGLNQLGLATIVIEASDTFLAADTQTISLNVTCVNQPPAILSRPVTAAIADGRYIYGLRAIDPENAPLAFALSTAPAGMSIDPATGVIRWTPSVAQLGNADVVVRATDPSGASAEQSFTINVSQVVPDLAPIFRTRAAFRATVDELYEYAAQAVDPEGSAVTYALITAPAGMTITPNAGLVQWTPTAAQSGSHIVIVAADDAGGHRSQQRYALLARVNQAPEIVSTPTTTLSAGAVFQYDVQVDDPESDPIGFALLDAPAGMTIDELGRITWSTQLADLGPHDVTIQAIDAHGLTDEQSFTLTVAPDTIGPVVSVQLSTPSVAIGNAVVITVQAMDDVGVDSLTLTVNGQAVTLNDQGTAVFTPHTPGQLNVVATAADAAGNIGQGSALLRAFDPNDTSGPTVEITNPSTGSVVTALTDIVGTASDPNLEFYRVEYARADLVNANDPTGADADWNLIVESTTSVVNDKLGTFDPTMLLNDSYVVRVIAQDTSGNVAARVVELSIEGALKLGPLSTSFTDLAIPLAGISVTVVRGYDSRDANDEGDFGFGWKLVGQDASIRESVQVSPFEQQGVPFAAEPFRIGTRVYLTNPSGRRVAFTFDPTPQFSLFGGGFWLPRFRPDPGVYDTLEVDATALQLRADGTFGIHFIGFPYNPSVYRLTTKEQFTYQYDQFAGLQSIADRNGNTITYLEDAIESSTGESIQFVRDSFGRIARVIDPAGKAIEYHYNAQGDLASVTDRAGLTTTLAYYSDPAHYLRSVVDSLGHELLQNEYDENGRLIGITSATGGLVQTDYDPEARTETITDALGNQTITQFDERGNPLTVTDALGNVRTMTYDAEGNVLTATDPLGHTVTRVVDAKGNLTSIEDPFGNATTVTYRSDNQVDTVTDALGRTAQYYYDAQGNLERMINAIGEESSFTRDAQGRVTTQTDGLGRVTQYFYDGDAARPTRTVYPDGSERIQEYDVNGRITRAFDEEGNETLYSYDANGRPLTQTDALGNTVTMRYEGSNLTEIEDALGNVTRYEYDEAGRRTRAIDALGAITQYAYNANDQVVDVTDPRGGVTHYEYRDDNRVDFVTDALGNITRFEYDDTGNRTAVIDARLKRTEYEYDALGRLLKKIDPLGNDETYAYDASGKYVSTTDANGHTTEFEYDDLNRLAATVDPLGARATFEYDHAGNLISVTDENGHTTEFEYDSRNRMERLILPTGGERGFTYDDIGNLLTLTDERGEVTTHAYDELNRRTSTTDGLGRVTQYDFDELGNTIRITDPLGRATEFAFDAVSCVMSTTDAVGRVTSFEYDGAGNRTAVVDAVGQRTEFDYDLMGNLLERTDPRGLTATFEYDDVYNLIGVTDRNGRVRRYEYDDVNRLTDEIWLDGVGAELRRLEYGFDAVGNPTSASDPAASYTYGYDALNQLISTQSELAGGLINLDFAETYDDVGNRLSITDSLGVSRVATFNERNQALSLTWQGGGIDAARVEYQYSLRGERTLIERYSDALGTNRVGSSEFVYDELGMLTDLTHRDALDAVLADYDYDFNELGQLIAESHHGASTSYEYDELGQLLAADHSGLDDEAFDYDDTGNRVAPGNVIEDGNLLTADAVFDYTYDNESNLTSRRNRATNEVTDYAYDHRNRLVSVDEFDGGGGLVQRSVYTYDAYDRRIGKAIDGVATFTAYDGSDAWADFDATGNVTTRYLFGTQIDEPLARFRPGEGTVWYLADRLGSVRDLAGEDGTIVDHIDYDSFGNVVAETDPALGDRFKFTAREYDAESGLYYYRARYYDPASGRFLSQDPLGFRAGDANFHRYVQNSPTNFTDPTGWFAMSEWTANLAANKAILDTAINYGGNEPFTFTVRGSARGISGGFDANPTLSGGIPTGAGDIGASFGLAGGGSLSAPIPEGGGGVKVSFDRDGGGSVELEKPTKNAPGTSAPINQLAKHGPPIKFGWPGKPDTPPDESEFEFLVSATAKERNLIASFNVAVFAGVAAELELIAKYAVTDDMSTLVTVNFKDPDDGSWVSHGFATREPTLPPYGTSGGGGPHGDGSTPPTPTPPGGGGGSPNPGNGPAPGGPPNDGGGGGGGGGSYWFCVFVTPNRSFRRDVTVAYAWNDYYADCCLEFVRRDYVTCCDGGLPL